MPDDFKMSMSYHWLHIESGKTGVNTTRVEDRFEFLELLNKWNRDLRWKYWEV